MKPGHRVKPWNGTLCPRYEKLDKRYVLPVHIHPSSNCYQNHDCRCRGCLDAYNAHRAELRKVREMKRCRNCGDARHETHECKIDGPWFPAEGKNRMDYADEAERISRLVAVDILHEHEMDHGQGDVPPKEGSQESDRGMSLLHNRTAEVSE